MTKKDGVDLYVTYFPELPYLRESNSSQPKYIEQLNIYIHEHLSNTVTISTYPGIIDYYLKHKVTPKTAFSFEHDSHATDFGNMKLGELIGNAIEKKLKETNKVAND
jgi:hypothetical protein